MPDSPRTNQPTSLNFKLGASILAIAALALVFLVYVWGWVHPTLEATQLALGFIEKLLWPAVAVLALLVFRRPLAQLVGSLDSIKLAAGSFSLEGSSQIYSSRVGKELAEPLKRSLLAGKGGARLEIKTDGYNIGRNTEGWLELEELDVKYAITDEVPNMGMLKAFIDLESALRREYNFRFPEEKQEARVVSVSKMARKLNNETEEFINYLAAVRNGLVHSGAPDYESEEAWEYVRQCVLARIALTSPRTWSG